MKSYELSQSQVYLILNKYSNENEEWATKLPMQTFNAISEIMIRDIGVDIQYLERIRDDAAKDPDKEIFVAQTTSKVIDHKMKYLDAVVNELSHRKAQELIKEAERVIEMGRTK